MNEKIIINARIVDPSQKLDEMGSIIIDKNGKVKAIGKKVTKKDYPNAEVIDVVGENSDQNSTDNSNDETKIQKTSKTQVEVN